MSWGPPFNSLYPKSDLLQGRVFFFPPKAPLCWSFPKAFSCLSFLCTAEQQWGSCTSAFPRYWGRWVATNAAKHLLVSIHPLILLFLFVLYGYKRLLDWVAYIEHTCILLMVLEKPKDKREHLETWLHYPMVKAGRARTHSRTRDGKERESHVLSYSWDNDITSIMMYSPHDLCYGLNVKCLPQVDMFEQLVLS